MNRGAVLFGLVAVAFMLFVPPREVTTYDSVGETTDRMLGGDRVTKAEHTAARLVYLPLTTEITAESVGEAGEVESVGLATDRLFLQLLVVVVVVGGVELLVGRTDENASAESG